MSEGSSEGPGPPYVLQRLKPQTVLVSLVSVNVKQCITKPVFFKIQIASLLLCVNCFDVILISMDLFYAKDNFSLIVVN